ncbi:oligosaccharide flippase family protein [Paenibacillus daejeonensis]|uniref:oligosaccharide flippase family protein n=1 Tax=Paenibacillus daejeonensis TaxID=135193 RepID=UPI0003804765|nr:oligosaccharide flippase family protein [Paenibacillus daejeonensis]
MDKKGMLFQIVSTLGTRVVVLFGAFVVSVIMARLLGPEGKGIITAILVIPTLVVTIADLGIRQATAFFIGQRTYEQRDIVSSLTFLWLLTSLLSVGIVTVIFLLQYSGQYSWWLLGVCIMTIPVNLGIQYLRGIMQGRGRIGGINRVEIVKTALNFIILMLLVGWLGLGVFGAALTQLLLLLVTLVYSFGLLKGEIGFSIRVVKPIPQMLIRKGFAFALALFVIQLNYRIDIVFLERLTSATEVGLYSVGTNIAELIWQLPTAIGLILFSRSAGSKTTEAAVARTSKLIRLVVPTLVVCGTLFWLMAPVMIDLMYGSAFAGSGTIIRYLLPGIIIMVIFKLLHADLSGRGAPLFSMRVSLLALVVNIVLNLMLIPGYGAIGSAVASSISYGIAGLLFVWLYVRREGIPLRSVLLPTAEDRQEIRAKLGKLRARIAPSG